MRVLVAGARSALGSRVTTLLKADGHQVIGLTRDPRAGQGYVVADVLDAKATERAIDIAAPDVIVQTLNALPKDGPKSVADLEATGRLRVEGTRNLISAASNAGVQRFVSENFFFIYGSSPVGAPLMTEDDSTEAGTEVTRSQDQQVRDFGGVVLRCGLFYGPGVGSTEHLVDLVRRRRAPVIRGATNKYSQLHIDDAAAAVVAAIEHGKPGAAYNIADDVPAGPQDMIRDIAQLLGLPKPLAVPGFVVRRLVNDYLSAVLAGNLTVSNAKARSDLGWAPAYPSIHEGLKTVVPGPISSAM